MVEAVAEAAPDHVGPQGVVVAGVDVHGVPRHRLPQAEPAFFPAAGVLNPDGVARVPLAVAPAPAAPEAPLAGRLLPGGQRVSPVEEAVPAVGLDAARQPLEEAVEHAFGAREGGRVARGETAGDPAARHPPGVDRGLGPVEQARQPSGRLSALFAAEEIEEELRGPGGAEAVAVHPFPLVPGHLLGVPPEIEPPAVRVLPQEQVDAPRIQAEGLGVLLGEMAQGDSDAGLLPRQQGPAGCPLPFLQDLRNLSSPPFQAEPAVMVLGEKQGVLRCEDPFHGPVVSLGCVAQVVLPWSAVPAHLVSPRTRRSQGDSHRQLLQLGLPRIAGDHHGVQHPHEGMAGEGMDPGHQAEGAVPGVMVHRGLCLQGSLAADHRPQRPGLLHLNAVATLRQRCPAGAAHAVDTPARPFHRGGFGDAGPGIPRIRSDDDLADESAR